MQTLTQPELLLKPFAQSGTKNTIPDVNSDTSNPQLADLTNGFPAITSEDPDNGGLPPERADFNGLGYLTTTYDYFYQAGGTFTYSTTIANAINGYPKGARLWYTDANGNSTILISAKGNNKDNFLTNSSFIGTSWIPETPALGWNNVWTGSNTFTSSILRRSALSGSLSEIVRIDDSNGNGGTWFGAYYSSNAVIGRISASNAQSQKIGYVQVESYGSGSVAVTVGATSGANVVNTTEATSATTSNVLATKGWVNNPSTATNVVHRSGNETIAGTKTFSSTISGNISGNAATVTNGVYTTGNQTIGGTKTFSNTISGNINGNAATVTNGVYTTGNQTIAGTKTFSGTLKATTASTTDHSTTVATTDWGQSLFANAIGTPRNVTVLWGNGTGVGNPTQFDLSESFTNFEQIAVFMAGDDGNGRKMEIHSTFWLDYMLGNSGTNTVNLWDNQYAYLSISSYNATNKSTKTKFIVTAENNVSYYIFGLNRKVKTVPNPMP